VNYFDFLAAGFAILALISVYQMRPCSLILAGNNLLAARALSGFERVGQPSSYWYLPASLFGQENLNVAGTILAITFATMLLFAIASIRKRERIGMDAPAVPRWFLLAMVPYLVAVTVSSSTILTGKYAADTDYRYDFNLGGAHTMIVSLLLYELARRRLLGLINPRRAFSIMFLIFAATGYAKGGTGLTTGYLVVSAMLLLPRSGSSRRLGNLLRVSGAILAIVALSFVVRGVRATLAGSGAVSVSDFVTELRVREAAREETGEGAEAVANADQSAAHMLMCTTLYDTGRSREWRSIYGLVEYTFIPSFFVRWLGWQRSIEPAWELAEHYIHGGGINVLGEFYWNGGYVCVVIMVLALVLFCTVADLRFRASPFWLLMLTQFAPSFLMGYGYGFPHVGRGAVNGFVVVVAYKVLAALRGAPEASMRDRRMPPAPTAQPAGES
jgi:hypothetical protein